MLNQIAAIHGTGVAASTTSYESIATVTVGAGGSSTITFSSIPSTYKHLQIRAMCLKSSNPGTLMTINGDTVKNYPQHLLYGNGTSAASAADLTNYAGMAWAMDDLSSSTIPAVAIIDILDYTDTNKYKTIRSLNGADKNGTGQIVFASGFNKTITAAITSITFSSSANFNQYSSFALYGIKG